MLSFVFGALLIFAGVAGLTVIDRRLNFGRAAAWTAGGLSGLFGGLVGNQGGIRSAALLGFDLRKEEFVATATAVALIVDGARMPVYFATQTRPLLAAWIPMVIGAAGRWSAHFREWNFCGASLSRCSGGCCRG